MRLYLKNSLFQNFQKNKRVGTQGKMLSSTDHLTNANHSNIKIFIFNPPNWPNPQAWPQFSVREATERQARTHTLVGDKVG